MPAPLAQSRAVADTGRDKIEVREEPSLAPLSHRGANLGDDELQPAAVVAVARPRTGIRNAAVTGKAAGMTGDAQANEAAGDPSGTKFRHSTRLLNQILAVDSVYCTNIRANDELTLEDVLTEFRLYSDEVLDLLVDLFTMYTGSRSAVCIKALRQEDEAQLVNCEEADLGRDFAKVATFLRDPHSRTERGQTDEQPGLGVYDLSANSGLRKAKQAGYWYCNDLEAEGESYESIHRKWNEHYNATAIHALAYPSEGKLVRPFGFLCIDNFGGGFDGDACRDMMGIAANILYYTIRVTTAVSDARGTLT
jgi:hypothetical protein